MVWFEGQVGTARNAVVAADTSPPPGTCSGYEHNLAVLDRQYWVQRCGTKRQVWVILVVENRGGLGSSYDFAFTAKSDTRNCFVSTICTRNTGLATVFRFWCPGSRVKVKILGSRV
eukprot:1795533-Rhodomonas_salina.6